MKGENKTKQRTINQEVEATAQEKDKQGQNLAVRVEMRRKRREAKIINILGQEPGAMWKTRTYPKHNRLVGHNFKDLLWKNPF